MKREFQFVHAPPPEFASCGPLPVRVRSRTGEVIGSGVTGLPISVPAGSYYVSVLTPDGREVGSDHKVRVGASNPIASDAMEADPMAAAPAMAFQPALVPPPPAQDAQTFASTTWRGNWLAAWSAGPPDLSRCVPDLTLSTGEPAILPQEDGTDRLIVMPLEDRVRCTIIPYDECAICLDESAQARAITARLTMAESGPLLEYRSIVSDETNALLGFVESGVLTNMVAVTEDEVQRGEEALSGSRASVLRAITGAYVLLRANALEGLERWLGQLEAQGANLPDLLPLRAELCARVGGHVRAVELIRGWIETGRCPWFRAGLSYMQERLRLYVDVTDNKSADFNLDAGDYQRFLTARDTLERMLPAMLTTRYIATFDLPRAS